MADTNVDEEGRETTVQFDVDATLEPNRWSVKKSTHGTTTAEHGAAAHHVTADFGDRRSPYHHEAQDP